MVSDPEREIRNAVVDILCFLSSGKATEAQMVDLEALLIQAVEIVRKSSIEERLSA